jgi:hypothetical protein
MKIELYYLVKTLNFSGHKEYEYAAGPFKSWAKALDEKLEMNSSYGVNVFEIVQHDIEVEMK